MSSRISCCEFMCSYLVPRRSRAEGFLACEIRFTRYGSGSCYQPYAIGYMLLPPAISHSPYAISPSCPRIDGMSTLAIKFGPLAVDMAFTDTMLRVILADWREVSAPVAWFTRLLNATAEQRRNWRLIGGGIGIHWESIDEDISVESLLSVQ